MKSIYKLLKSSFGLIAMVLLATACSEDYKYDADYSSYNDVELKINLVDDNNVLAVKLANKTHALTVAVTPEGKFIDSKAYIYEVEDPSIASVSIDGMMTLLKVGETNLTLKFRGNQDIQTSCKLHVLPTFVSDLVVGGNAIKVEEGKELDLRPFVTVIPSTADNQELIFSMKEGSETLAEFEEGSSVLKALNKGMATVVISTTDGSNVSTEMEVEITGKIPVEQIVMNGADKLNGKKVAIGQAFDLTTLVTVYPENASDQRLVYTLVSGAGSVSLQDGLITALAAGEAEVKIEAADGFGVAPAQTIKFTVDPTLNWFERAMWSIDSSIEYANGNNYTQDGSNGPLPLALDGKTNTYLALTKPGKKYNEEVTPAGYDLYLVMDMSAQQTFNHCTYTHRDNRTQFQAWKISLYGSNDGKNYSVIEENIKVGSKSDTAVTVEFDVPETTCRYIKLQFKEWNTGSGLNMCIAEFNVSKK